MRWCKKQSHHEWPKANSDSVSLEEEDRKSRWRLFGVVQPTSALLEVWLSSNGVVGHNLDGPAEDIWVRLQLLESFGVYIKAWTGAFGSHGILASRLRFGII